MPVPLVKRQEIVAEDLCPPLCRELWNGICPLVYALCNGAVLHHKNIGAKIFGAECPDEGRVSIHGILGRTDACYFRGSPRRTSKQEPFYGYGNERRRGNE